jgi:hypothetical protein
MRFILNFFFYGLLFFLIYLFFPEAFNTLVSWANETYIFLRDFIQKAIGTVKETKKDDLPAPQQAMILLLSFSFWKRS